MSGATCPRRVIVSLNGRCGIANFQVLPHTRTNTPNLVGSCGMCMGGSSFAC